MKKVIIVLFIISLCYITMNKDEIIIPTDSVRFRIIANSNSIEDQTIKNEIKQELLDNVFNKVSTKLDIEKSIPDIEKVINKYGINYDINYGKNYFPEKTYKGITYPSGYYDSLVLTLDKGLGKNFWCVLYPPLCLVEEQADTDNVSYQFMIKNIIDNYKK